MGKSTILTYILWLFGGGLGLHHFYLGRDRQAFTWLCTWGGYGIGWLRDFFRIPEYVSDANEDVIYMAELRAKMSIRSKPQFSSWRFGGELVMGWLFAFLTRAAVPEDLIEQNVMPYKMVVYIVPYAAALGVHTVAGIGREKGSLKIAVIGAYLPFLLYFYNPAFIGYCTVSSAIAVNWKGKSWRARQSKKRFCKRAFLLLCAASLFYGLWASVFWNNAFVTTKDGERIPLKVAVKNFFTSPAWAETKETINRLWEFYLEHGWDKFYEEFVVSIDPEGETNAYKVLNLSSSATEEEIKQRYRKLAKEWHPDKQKDPKKRDAAAEQFMKIQQAYETLSSIKSKRSKKSQQSDSDYREKDEF